MSSLSDSDLQEYARARWSMARPLLKAEWKRLAEAGLYEWARQHQQPALIAARYMRTPVVPLLEELGLEPQVTVALEPVARPTHEQLWEAFLGSVRSSGFAGSLAVESLGQLQPVSFDSVANTLTVQHLDPHFASFVAESFADLLKGGKDALRIEVRHGSAALVAPPTAAKGVSRLTLNKSRRAATAVLQRNSKTQDLAFSPREFVLFSLPHRPLPKGQQSFERVNGRYRITIETNAPHAVPFGQDRLFPLWLASAFNAAGQPADGVIRFRAAADLLRAFDQDVHSSKTRHTLKERVLRWYKTSVDIVNTEAAGADSRRRFSLIKGFDLWFERDQAVNQFSLWQNRIILTEEFATSLRQGAIPIDFATVKALKDSPGALDLYIWQAHRSWELAQRGAVRPTAVPMASLLGQLGVGASEPRKARQMFRGWQATIKEVWPDCPNFFDGKNNLFFLYAATAVHSASEVSLPGVAKNPPVPAREILEATQGRLISTADEFSSQADDRLKPS